MSVSHEPFFGFMGTAVCKNSFSCEWGLAVEVALKT